jgi:hypothetical protein
LGELGKTFASGLLMLGSPVVPVLRQHDLEEMAKTYPDSLLVADHDLIGIKVAKQVAHPYWVSPVEGEDFNDYEIRVGAEKAGEELGSLIQSTKH